MKSLVNFNEEHYTYFISWLAQMIQEPHILPDTCWIFISEEGVGKDIFQKFVAACIGKTYTANTEKLDQICGTFNTLLGGKILFTINETNPLESRQRIENIKYLVTATDLVIEEKYKNPIVCDNYCRFMFFSNKLFAFPAETGNRRPIIFKSSEKYLPSSYGIEENRKYFVDLVALCKNPKYQSKFLHNTKVNFSYTHLPQVPNFLCCQR